jgi:hypothetical protein
MALPGGRQCRGVMAYHCHGVNSIVSLNYLYMFDFDLSRQCGRMSCTCVQVTNVNLLGVPIFSVDREIISFSVRRYHQISVLSHD